MTRTLLTTALLLAIGTAHAQSVDAPPSTPGNPVARAYGPTSGGISWQRSSDDRRVIGYEITRDGTVLGVRDTLSYVAEDLRPGRSHSFVVVAIDSAGQRSGRAITRIETPDARPNRPTGLSANVYSATAAGITWERSGVFGERYEVKRDGEIVAAATNGTSYVDTTLSGRRPYLFEVVAVNRQGQRSTAARLFVRTTDGSTAPPMSSGPSAPSELRSILYSATAGAIAWDRGSVAGLRYEVSRDGDVVAMTNGTSYVDRNLADGQSYRYEVIAIDRQGQRSTPSAVSLGTGGDDDSPSRTITVDNRGTILAQVLEVVRGSLYDEMFDIADGLRLNAVLTRVETTTSPEGTVIRYACDNGGTATVTRVGNSQLDEFDQCAYEELVLDGAVSAGLRSDFRLTAFSIDGPGALRRTLTGSIFRASGAQVFTRGANVTRYRRENAGGTTLIENANTSLENNIETRPGEERASFRATVTAPWTGGEPLTIETTERFVREVSMPYHDTGALVVRAADGSSLTLDAANGDPETFQLIVETDGSISAFTEDWSPEDVLPCTGLAEDDAAPENCTYTIM